MRISDNEVKAARRALRTGESTVYLTGKGGETLKVSALKRRRWGSYAVQIPNFGGWVDPNDYWTLEVV